MTKPYAPATLVVSLDVDSALSGQPTAARRPVEAAVDDAISSAVDSLLRFFADHDVPATWNFAEPASSPLAERVQADGSDHEVALSASSSWAGGDVGRRYFSAELSLRMAAAHNAGYSISTLSLGNGAAAQQPDVLVQHGITAVCQQATARTENTHATGRFTLGVWRGATGGAESTSQPRPLRWGLWHVPAGCDLLHATPRRTRQQIEQAARRGGLLLCQVDVSALLDRNGKPLRTLDAAFTYILDQRDAGQLRISTMAQAVNTLRRQSAPPARSILHRQAA